MASLIKLACTAVTAGAVDGPAQAVTVVGAGVDVGGGAVETQGLIFFGLRRVHGGKASRALAGDVGVEGGAEFPPKMAKAASVALAWSSAASLRRAARRSTIIKAISMAACFRSASAL